jgi:integrase/recombinase XerD
MRKQPASLTPASQHDLTDRLTFDSQILAGQLAPSSLAMYQRDFQAYLRFAGSPAAAMDAATLARWRAHLAQETTMSPNTINRMISAVKRLMREAAVQGYVPSGVAAAFDNIAGVKTAALKTRIKPAARTRIEPNTMRKMCDTPDTQALIGLRDTALLATLASSGLRVSEVAGMAVTQIVTKGSSFVVLIRGKNDVEVREAPLSREAYAHIQSWLERRPVQSSFIFTAFAGRGERALARAMSVVSIWRVVRKYAEANDLDNVKPHDFRRFVGTQLARNNLRMAQKALGHKRLETTARHYILDELEAGLTDGLY